MKESQHIEWKETWRDEEGGMGGPAVNPPSTSLLPRLPAKPLATQETP